ncbi:MAG TPA: cysteine dioxygenase family protein [Coxiellaceae bacterium]|nr:cysteine dioxygenase family protein [Coxiellaceae bacterium]
MNTLQSFFQSLKKINLNQPEEKILQAVSSLMKTCIAHTDDWFEDRFYEIDEEQGFGSHLIAENPDHTLAVIITSWITNRETPPHDHNTWAVIGSVKGVECNTMWRRLDDGSKPDYAKIERLQTQRCQHGDMVMMKKNDIHSVVNPEKDISVSLHVYGKHFNYTQRHQFDPINNTVQPFIVKQTPIK